MNGIEDSTLHTKWTHTRRFFLSESILYELLKKNGVITVIERDENG